MRAIVPEIAWHNKNPVFTIDIQPEISKSFYRAATGGGDFHIVIWHMTILNEKVGNENKVSVEFVADLDRHIKAVNVVRFSHDAKFLASGDDDAVIIIWTLKEDQNYHNSTTLSEDSNKENWVSVKVLRGHKDDIYDLQWSPSSAELISGSVDNTAIIWNLSKGQSTGTIGEHNGFVQGVAWDPKGRCLATLCSDRALRIFDAETRKMTSKITKARYNKVSNQDEPESEENLIRLFHDDTVKTFFRRLCFSPDGFLVFAPCGLFRDGDNEAKSPINVTYVFLKYKPERPILHLPSPDEYTVAVRCCPTLFELNPSDSNFFSLPYRIIFAIASRRSIVFYDTQQIPPFAYVTDIHYATLTDITWSQDGRLLLASSSDGYCTIITFNEGELGVPYKKTSLHQSPLHKKTFDDSTEDLGVQPLKQSDIQVILNVENAQSEILNREVKTLKPNHSPAHVKPKVVVENKGETGNMAEVISVGIPSSQTGWRYREANSISKANSKANNKANNWKTVRGRRRLNDSPAKKKPDAVDNKEEKTGGEVLEVIPMDVDVDRGHPIGNPLRRQNVVSNQK